MLLLKRVHLTITMLGLQFPLWSCAKMANPSAQSRPEVSIADDLQSFLLEYKTEAIAAQTPVEASYEKQLVRLEWSDNLGERDDEHILGRCDRLNENHPDPAQRYRVVHIQRPNAQGMVGSIKMDRATLRTVVFHELGHCLHNYHGHLPESEEQIMSSELPEQRFGQWQSLLRAHFQLMKKAS